MRHKAAKVASNDAVPGGALPLIELFEQDRCQQRNRPLSGEGVCGFAYRLLDVLRDVLPGSCQLLHSQELIMDIAFHGRDMEAWKVANLLDRELGHGFLGYVRHVPGQLSGRRTQAVYRPHIPTSTASCCISSVFMSLN